MEKTTLHDTLVDALAYAHVSDLPKKDNGKRLWIYAIALVSKKDGTMAYCILKRNDLESYSYKAVFGTCSPLHNVAEIYPYEFADSLPVPKFAPNDKSNRIEFIQSVRGADFDCSEMSVKELENEIIRIGIEKYMQK